MDNAIWEGYRELSGSTESEKLGNLIFKFDLKFLIIERSFLEYAIIDHIIIFVCKRRTSDMYTALDFAKYIVKKCIDDGQPISNLQLQKILFYIQKDFLQRDQLAFCDEIEAWQFGPVVPNVYYHYCGYGAMNITHNSEDLLLDGATARIVNPIIEGKRVLSPWTMVAETHKPNGAWDRTYCNGNGNRHTIPTELIKTAG
ncbi:MAG: DUF4065 domain-containing protein [Lachnospiraceae bacterium]|nr:DUF4065 domain-containing protein [Lachnospiraceae bacterium]